MTKTKTAPITEEASALARERSKASNILRMVRGSQKQGKAAIYISGPMRGRKFFNRPAFVEASKALQSVFDPGLNSLHILDPSQVEADRGFDALDLPEETDWNAHPAEWGSITDTMVQDLKMVAQASHVVVLKGWEASKGAMAEVSFALSCGIPVLEFDTGKRIQWAQEGSTRVLFLNGPPEVGKDSLGAVIKDFVETSVLQSFKTPLYEVLASLYQIPLPRVISLCSDRDFKDTPAAAFKGKTPREALIFASENILKPYFGQSYIGELASSRIVPGVLNIFTDSGFVPEAEPVVKMVGSQNCALVHMSRKGRTFAGKNDSRGYIELDGVYKTEMEVHDGEEPEANARSLLQNPYLYQFFYRPTLRLEVV